MARQLLSIWGVSREAPLCAGLKQGPLCLISLPSRLIPTLAVGGCWISFNEKQEHGYRERSFGFKKLSLL